jgi:hypothetical protein
MPCNFFNKNYFSVLLQAVFDVEGFLKISVDGSPVEYMMLFSLLD